VSIVLGLGLGAGLTLIAASWLWPATASHAGRGVAFGMRTRLAQAGLDRVPTSAFLIVSVAIAVAVGGVVVSILPVIAVAVAGGVVAGLLPTAAVSARARSRRRMMRTAWPDLVDHLLSSVRSGQSLSDGVAALAEVGPAEIRGAFRDFGVSVVATGTMGTALDDLKLRLSDPVADRIVETLRMAREVGGTELPAVLRALAASLRQDAALRAEVEARQSWVVNAARLGVAAPWIVLVLLGSRPEAAAAYNSPTGLALLGVGFTVTVVAYRLMVALGRLPEERRWFA
jgi:tight adherence protein B